MNLLSLILLALSALALAWLAVKYIGGDVTAIDDWRRAWRYYSIWAFAAIGLLPEAYSAIVAAGLLSGGDVPPALAWGLRFAAVGGILLRLVKQAQPPKPDDTDRAGA